MALYHTVDNQIGMCLIGAPKIICVKIISAAIIILAVAHLHMWQTTRCIEFLFNKTAH